jgi:hypothetical protein
MNIYSRFGSVLFLAFFLKFIYIMFFFAQFFFQFRNSGKTLLIMSSTIFTILHSNNSRKKNFFLFALFQLNLSQNNLSSESTNFSHLISLHENSDQLFFMLIHNLYARTNTFFSGRMRGFSVNQHKIF